MTILTRLKTPLSIPKPTNVDYKWSVEGKKVMNMLTNRKQQIADLKRLVSNGKIGKQIAAITDHSVRRALEKYVAFQLRSHPTGQHNTLIIMDIYGMTRILSEFVQTIDKHIPQFKETSGNIIYYAGADHIENMRLFLHPL